MKRRKLLQHGTLLLLLGVQHIARGAGIVAVRVWPAPEYSRVTIESDVPLVSHQTFVAEPPRLAVDIEGLTLDSGLRDLVARVQADDPNIERIRVGQYTANVVRLVIDLKRPASPQVFSLKPVAAYQHRLVFDLYPAVPEDPLQALINERFIEKAPAATASAPATAPTPVPTCALEGLDAQPVRPITPAVVSASKVLIMSYSSKWCCKAGSCEPVPSP
jgi:N-acetylmuramoyl-L-alanine amidase